MVLRTHTHHTATCLQKRLLALPNFGKQKFEFERVFTWRTHGMLATILTGRSACGRLEKSASYAGWLGQGGQDLKTAFAAAYAR